MMMMFVHLSVSVIGSEMSFEFRVIYLIVLMLHDKEIDDSSYDVDERPDTDSKKCA